MAGRIPQQFLDDLLARTDIVDIVSERMQLRKAGSNHSARCPFHNEKSPSFTVSQPKQFYHCFGCGAHGNAIGFVMEFDRLDFLDAVELLAQRAGVEIPREQQRSQSSGQKDLYRLLDDIAKFYQQQLKSHAAGHLAVDYLKNRGLTGQVAKTYGIGFAPPGWEHVLERFGHDDTSRKALERAGMLIKKNDGGYYDRFRNRIMFPIRDRRGRTIAFGGRVLSNDDQPKYLNSPETPVFHKGQEVYGLYEALQAERHLDQVLLVEGYMDVVALAQHGISCAVATLGTAATKDHLQRLYRYSDNIVFCFDGDNAGRTAAWRALETVLPLLQDGYSARFMFLPEGDDPDSLVRRVGQQEFLQQVQHARSLDDFFLQHLGEQAGDTNDLDHRARLTQLAKPLLEQLPDGVYRHLLTEKLANNVGVSSEQLQQLSGISTPAPQVKTRSKTSGGKLTPIRLAIALLLQQPPLASSVTNIDELSALPIAGADLLAELLRLVKDKPTLTTGALLEHWRDHPHGEHLAKLAMWQHPVSGADLEAEFLGALQCLTDQAHEQNLDQLLAKSQREGLNDNERQLLRSLLQQKHHAEES